MYFSHSDQQITIIFELWRDFFIHSCLNKYTSNTQCSVSQRNDEMPFILQPKTQDRKILLEMTKKSETQNSAVKIKDRYMRFAGPFLYRPARLMYWK